MQSCVAESSEGAMQNMLLLGEPPLMTENIIIMAEFHTVSQLLHVLRVAGPHADKTKPPSVQSWLQAVM